MRQTISGSVVMCLVGGLLGLSTTAAAQGPDASEGGGRVELTDRGFAITLPEGWAGFDISGDLEIQVGALVEAVGDGWEPDAADLLARLEATQGQYDLVAMDLASIAAGDVSTSQVCSVGAAEVLEGYSLDELAPAVASEFESMEQVEVTRGPVALGLPSGPAYVIDITQPGPDDLAARVPTAIYLLADDDELRVIDCLGPTAPADDWLSIIGTWEWLPAEAAGATTESRSVVRGGRIEVPDQGYALTAPADWISIVPTTEDADVIIETLREIDPDLAATAEAGLASGTSFSLMTFGAFDHEAGFRENCNVIDYPSDGDPMGYTLSEDAVAMKGMENLATGPETTILELPSGSVGRLDYGLRYPAFQTAHAAYYFTDGTVFHLMTCTHLQRPEDDWLSIAETFEFLESAAPPE